MEDKKITFKFVRPDHVTVKPVNTFWVYETERGMLVDLCFDRPRPTMSVTHSVTADDKLGPEVGSIVGDEFPREVMASVELTPQFALALGKYLVDAAKRRGAVDHEVGAAAVSDKVH